MLNDQLIDKRIVERNIKKGRIDVADYRCMLAALPDLTNKLLRQEERAQPAVVSTPAAEPAHAGWSDDSALPAPLG